jgi:hypothetical protein
MGVVDGNGFVFDALARRRPVVTMISMSQASTHHVWVVFHVVLTDAVAVRAFARHALTSIAENLASFPDLPFPLVDFKNEVDGLDEAIQAASPHAGGSIALRTPKLADVVSSLHYLKAHVQWRCDRIPYADGAALATLAGLGTQADYQRHKEMLEVGKGPQPNTVKLIGFAKLLGDSLRGRIQYHWLVSTNQGATWTERQVTTNSSTILPEIPVGTELLYRVYASSSSANGELSPIVPFTLH